MESILAEFEGDRRNFLQTVFEHTEFKKVWGSLNFETLLQSHSYDRSRVVSALDYLHEKNLIELETKRLTEVFKVNQKNLQEADLIDSLHNYFLAKEDSEIKRIAMLLRFFELDKCLSNRLSAYFDDHETPESCGHCSVCRGLVAKLEYSEIPPMPDESRLTEALTQLKDHLSEKSSVPLSIDTYSRFLAGISVPLFSRNKVRGLTGFALCEQFRYQDIRSKVSQLLNQL